MIPEKTPEWSEIKGKIKAQWSKFADPDLESLKGNLHLIPEKIQKIYGYAKDKADKEFADFKTSLDAKAPTTTTPKPN